MLPCLSNLLQSGAGSQSFLDFHDLDKFKSQGQLFPRMFLSLGLSDVTSRLDAGSAPLSELRAYRLNQYDTIPWGSEDQEGSRNATLCRMLKE